MLNRNFWGKFRPGRLIETLECINQPCPLVFSLKAEIVDKRRMYIHTLSIKNWILKIRILGYFWILTAFLNKYDGEILQKRKCGK